MKRHQLRTAAWLSISLLGALLLLAYAAPSLAQGEDQLCIPELGVDPAFPNPPTLDGVVEDYVNPSSTLNPLEHDPGWNRATKINLKADLAGAVRTAKMLVGSTTNDLWFAITVETVITPAVNDTVVLMLATDNDPTHDWRIFIKPFTPASIGILDYKDELPDSVTYARGSGDWTTTGNDLAGIATRATWLRVRDETVVGAPPLTGTAKNASGLRVSRNGNIWSLEMRIPRIPALSITDPNDPGISFPTSTSSPATFRMYVNVLSTDDLFGTFHDGPWPTLMQSRIVGPLTTTGPTQLEFNTPPKDTADATPLPIWGTASLFNRPSECTGISLALGDVGVEDPSSTASLPPLISNIRAIPTASLPSPYPAPTGTQTDVDACLAIPDGTFPGTVGPVNAFGARPTSTLTFTPSHLKVAFRIANFGIPAPPNYQPWHLISGEPGISPAPPNPVECSSTTVPCTFTGGVRRVTMPWQLSYKQSCLYSKANSAHQCMMVEMESDDASVRFGNKSVMRNMDFVSASRFSRSAEISAIGYPAPPAGRANQQFIIAVDSGLQRHRTLMRASASASDKAPGKEVDRRYFPRINTEEIRRLVPRYFGNGVSEVMVWTARGYRRTGRNLEIGSKRYEYAEPVGAFSYVAGHNGPIKNWTQTLEGPGLAKVGENAYTLEIPPGQVATVNTTIEAVEPQTPSGGGFKRWGLSLHAGASIPHGDFDTFYNPGPNFGIDLEYRLKPKFSLEWIYGFHRFRGQRFDLFKVPDLKLHQISINAKAYTESSPLRGFLFGGGGVYHFDPSSTHGGLNIGVGLQRDITPTFAVEAMYNFHNVFTRGSSTRFSTVQGGVRFRF